MIRKMLAAVLLVHLALLGLAGQCPAQTQKANLVIAVGAPLTGTSAQDGNAIKDGVTLAADIINKKGGINGRQIEIISADDRSDPKEAASVANKFATDKRVLAVVGHFNSSCTLAGAPHLQQGEACRNQPRLHFSGGQQSRPPTPAGSS